jgi:hypothetical protein
MGSARPVLLASIEIGAVDMGCLTCFEKLAGRLRRTMVGGALSVPQCVWHRTDGKMVQVVRNVDEIPWRQLPTNF